MPKQHYRPTTFHLRDSIGYLVKRSQRLMQERIEALFVAQGCTLQQWVVMMHLRDGLASTVADLCRELHHDSGAMTRLIDQLEGRGFIERRRKEQDRRVVELQLTAEGNKALDALIPIATNTLNVAMEGFTRDEVKQLQSLLRRLLGGLEGLPSHAASTPAAEQES